MILYEGPSLLSPGDPIFVVALPDENPKTGRMLYTWILRQDRPPEVAAYDGSDAAICGDCKFRALDLKLSAEEMGRSEKERAAFVQQTRTCYVRLSPAEGADEETPPSEVWRHYKENKWPKVTSTEGGPGHGWTLSHDGYGQYRGQLPVRLGGYGDPAAVPTRVWAELVRYKPKQFMGFTHMWREPCPLCKQSGVNHNFYYGTISCGRCNGKKWVYPFDDLKRYCMASVDTPEEREEAQRLGWRTFTVVPDGARDKAYAVDPLWSHRDILCPATDPHPKRNATCSTCLLCRGTSAAAPSIWEVAHGKNKDNHQWT